MPKITINGQGYDVPAGKTVLQVCLEQGIKIPYFCYHHKLSIAGNCRMCLVEVVGRPKLEISCNCPVQEGMEIKTDSPVVLEARKSVLEFILINHPLDCPICDQAGECKLQDQYFDHSAVPYRFREQKVQKPKAVPLGPLVVLDDERCILCTRCVRFCDEVPKAHEIALSERGDRSTIVTYGTEGMKNAYSLNTVDICPVGALTSRDFRFGKRVWFLSKTPSLCTGCSTGCNVWLDQERGVAYRYRPRENNDVNECWMCDEGRLTYKYINAPDRVVTPFARSPENRQWTRASWDTVLAQLRTILAQVSVAERAVVLSAQCSNEENFAWTRLVRETWAGARLFATRREYPNPSEDQILRHCDKNPNARALSEFGIHERYAGGARVLFVLDALTPEEIAAVQQTRPACVVLLTTNWGVHPDAVRWRPLTNVDAVIEQGGAADRLDTLKTDTLEAPTPDPYPWADFVLPLATVAEQCGTFVNVKGRVQRFERAMPSQAEARPAWAVAQHVATLEGRPLPWEDAAAILAAIGETVPSFQGITWEQVGEFGTLLNGTAVRQCVSA
ncbi:MAG: (2Fe-2S)-binding protein [Deltaproteobacteria bacterium]|nr:(2Fe-2S)-binding protein [Deltaproteobacteria bacterium]